MKCPACKMYDITATELETSLASFNCSHCGGNWIRDAEYKEWRKNHGEDLPVKPTNEKAIQFTSVELARLCPDCNRILVKYKVGHDVNFTVDRCGGCGGVWLDKDEWTILKERNLHDNLYEFFTEPWQSEVRREEARRNMEFIYNNKFGEEDYERVKNFKEWMDEHPLRNQILAFVTDDSPLDV